MREEIISVIVPTYNSENTVEVCIQSLLNQTFRKDRYEIIIVDDGSTDKTGEIVRGFDVKYACQEHQGPAAARNEGVRISSGEIVVFTDADCIPDRHWLTEMVGPFRGDEVAAVKGVYRTHQKELMAKFCQAEFEERYELLNKHTYIDFVDSYAAAFRKSIFSEVGGFDSRFPIADHEDVDLSYRLASRGYRMVFQPQAIVYHQHQTTWRGYLALKARRGYWRIVVYKRFPKKALKDSYTPQTLKLQVLLSYLCLGSLISSIIISTFFYLFLLGSIIALATMLPFTIKTFKRDHIMGLLSPLFLTARALAIGFGVLKGFLFGRKLPT